jgi:hypothetical protein
MKIPKNILKKIYNIFSNIFKILKGKIKIYNEKSDKAIIYYKDRLGNSCKIKIKITKRGNKYTILEFDASEKYNNSISGNLILYYYYNNMDLTYIEQKQIDMWHMYVNYNKNKNIIYKTFNSNDIDYINKNNKKIFNYNDNIIVINKKKTYINNIWYLIKLKKINNSKFTNFFIYKYYIFNNYYIYCLKCHSNKYKYEKIKNYYIFNEYFFIIFI